MIELTIEEFETLAKALTFTGDPEDPNVMTTLMTLEGEAMEVVHRVRSRAGLDGSDPSS